VRERSRQRKAEGYLMGVLGAFEEQEGVPLVLLDSYADAVERYGLRDWRRSETDPTAGDAIDQARADYQRVIRAIGSFVADGGDERWAVFARALADYVPAAGLAVVTAQLALHGSDSGFSEHTDPAFIGLVEPGS
jgi:hypothetical protein